MAHSLFLLDLIIIHVCTKTSDVIRITLHTIDTLLPEGTLVAFFIKKHTVEGPFSGGSGSTNTIWNILCILHRGCSYEDMSQNMTSFKDGALDSYRIC